jgi:hypothetical protein
MRSRETFFRSRELKRESRTLPADLYNLTTILRHRSGEPALFIPIRSLLHLAVADAEEIIFLDGAVSRRDIALAWQKFRPQERTSLDEPIPYEIVYYAGNALNLMPHLQGEFHKALRQLREKMPIKTETPAKVIPLKKP